MIRLISILLASAALAGCSQTKSGPTMAAYGTAFPPPAFFAFCENEPELCSTTRGEKVVELTPRLRAELEEVNRTVNRTVFQRNDTGGSADGDRWQVALTSGDCEDIAIAKKSALIKRGWPASALLLTVVRMPYRDDGHTLLTVRTSEGDIVLDSLNSRVSNWSETDYRYFARQSQEKNGEWVQIHT